jgi:hypothetical protein
LLPVSIIRTFFDFFASGAYRRVDLPDMIFFQIGAVNSCDEFDSFGFGLTDSAISCNRSCASQKEVRWGLHGNYGKALSRKQAKRPALGQMIKPVEPPVKNVPDESNNTLLFASFLCYFHCHEGFSGKKLGLPPEA